jgi:hypothetical protein
MTSILFNNDLEILMKKEGANRGNRHIHKSKNMTNIIPLSGSIKILKKNKQLCEINYNINEDLISSSPKWHQLNPSNDQFVIQIKALYENNNLIVKKVAIQELAGIKDVLLNI